MVFSTSQCRSIRQHRMHAVLVPTSERVQAGRVRLLRRRATPDEDGHPRPGETVTDTTPDGERVAVVFTILAVRDLELAELTLQIARACAFRTTVGLIEAWRAEHPRSPLARLVSFELGDLRDRPRFLSRGWPDYTNDPSRAMWGEPEPVSHAQLRASSADAHQLYLRHQADRARELAQSSASDRLTAILAGTVVRDG